MSKLKRIEALLSNFYSTMPASRRHAAVDRLTSNLPETSPHATLQRLFKADTRDAYLILILILIATTESPDRFPPVSFSRAPFSSRLDDRNSNHTFRYCTAQTACPREWAVDCSSCSRSAEIPAPPTKAMPADVGTVTVASILPERLLHLLSKSLADRLGPDLVTMIAQLNRSTPRTSCGNASPRSTGRRAARR